jgi:hypothetical protein
MIWPDGGLKKMAVGIRPLILLIAPIALAQQPSSSAADNGSPFVALRFGEQLPEFEAVDVTGKTWTLKDLGGKLTLIYLWRTFGARAMDGHDAQWWETMIRPGLPDLPELQRFYDKLKRSGFRRPRSLRMERSSAWQIRRRSLSMMWWARGYGEGEL